MRLGRMRRSPSIPSELDLFMKNIDHIQMCIRGYGILVVNSFPIGIKLKLTFGFWLREPSMHFLSLNFLF